MTVLAVVAIATLLGGSLTTEGSPTNNPESERAEDARLAAFQSDPATSVTDIVVIRSEEYTVDSPQFRGFVRDFVADDRIPRSPQRAHTSTARLRVSSHGPARDDRPGRPLRDDDETEALVDKVEALDGGAFAVSVTGEETLDHDFNALSQEDLENGELKFGLPAALIILLLVFGAVVAGLVPLLMAIVAIVVALGLTALLAQEFELSVFVVNMLTGMGLALGIDYSLFVVSRYREERGRGRAELAAIEASGATASRAVLFSGSVFVIAMFGMLLVPNSIMRSLAVGAILVGIVSVVAALTLLPAVLGLLGDRVNALRIPIVGRRSLEASNPEGRFWGAIVRRVLHRPVLSLALSVGVLLALALPVLALDTGTTGVSALPDRFASKQGFLALERGFPGTTTEPARDRRLERLGGGRSGRPAPAPRDARRGSPLRRRRDQARSERRRCAPLRTDPRRRVRETGNGRSPRASQRDRPEDVREQRCRGARRWDELRERRLLRLGDRTGAVRDRLRPALDLRAPDGRLPLRCRRRDGGGAQPALGRRRLRPPRARLPGGSRRGPARLPDDGHDRGLGAALPLLRALRSLDGLPGVPALEDPRALRPIRGHHADAVTFGVGSTARIITGAALIIVAVFSGFARGDLIMFQQMGFGVAIALLIDATVIRSVVLPSAMKLLGDWNWYLPSWLEWLPRLEVESAP